MRNRLRQIAAAWNAFYNDWMQHDREWNREAMSGLGPDW